MQTKALLISSWWSAFSKETYLSSYLFGSQLNIHEVSRLVSGTSGISGISQTGLTQRSWHARYSLRSEDNFQWRRWLLFGEARMRARSRNVYSGLAAVFPFCLPLIKNADKKNLIGSNITLLREPRLSSQWHECQKPKTPPYQGTTFNAVSQIWWKSFRADLLNQP